MQHHDDAWTRCVKPRCRPETYLTFIQSVNRVAQLIVNFDDVPQSKLDVRIGPNRKKYFSIHGVVHMSKQSSLEFFVTVTGKRYGSLTAYYD
jgi:hypothetical protein